MLLLCLFNLVGQPHPFGSDGFFLNTFVVRGPKLNNWSPILLQGGGQTQILLTHGQKEKEKRSQGCPSNPWAISQWINLSFPRSLTKVFLHKNHWKIMYTYVYTYLVWIGLPSFSPPDEIWYFGKLKPLPIMLGKVAGKLVGAS